MSAPLTRAQAGAVEERRNGARRFWSLIVVLGVVMSQLFLQDIEAMLNTAALGWDAPNNMRAWVRMQIFGTGLFAIGVVLLFVGRKRSTLLWGPLLLGLGAAALQGLSAMAYGGRLSAPYRSGIVAEVLAPLVAGWRVLLGAGITWVATVALLLITLVHVPRPAPRFTGPRRSLWRRFRQGGWVRAVLMNPLDMFFGPIFFKEVRVLGRKRSTYVTRFLYPLGLLGLVTLVYFTAISGIEHQGGARRLQRLQEIAPQLAVTIAWFQFVLLLLIAPTLTGPAICDERRARTLSALMTTPMTSAQIVFGNFASRLAQVLILALVSAPFLLAIRLFGGLEPEAIVAIEAVTLSAVLLMAALGLLFSIWCTKPTVATASAVLSFVFLTVAPIVVFAIVISQMRGPPPLWLIPIGAPIAMGGITAELLGDGPGLPLSRMWTFNTGVNLVGTAVVCLIAAGALRRVMLSDATEIKRPVRSRRRSKKKAAALTPQAPADELPPADRPAAVPEPETGPEVQEVYEQRETQVGDRPVLWRELRAPAAGSRRNLSIIVTVVVLALAWLYYELPPWREEAHYVVCVVLTLLMSVQAALSTAGAIAGEKEGSTWMVLLTTPLSPWDILLGKAVGAIKRQWLGAAVLATHLVLGVMVGGVRPILAVHMVLILGGLIVLLTGTGLLFSLLFRKGATAASLNIGLAVLLWIGVPVLGGLIGELFNGGGTSDLIGDLVLCINPVFMAVTAVGGATAAHLRDYSLPTGHVSSYVFTSIAAFVALVYIAGGLSAIKLAARLFPRVSGRTS
jgi:ABC-type transport system involved in multi-copper enzyme maturation permease subunit